MIKIQTVNYSGHTFSDFEAGRDSLAKGWIVIGRNAEKYGRRSDGRGAYTMVCAWQGTARNGLKRGWPTKRDAEAIAQGMNAKPSIHPGSHAGATFERLTLPLAMVPQGDHWEIETGNERFNVWSRRVAS